MRDCMRNVFRIAASTVAVSAGLGLAGLGTAAIAEAQPAPAPVPDYHWCPGQWWDPGWGGNWDWGRCHDDHWFDNDPRDQGHWHGYGNDRDQGPWRGDRDQGPGDHR